MTSKRMKGLWFVIFVTSLYRYNSGRDDDDNDEDEIRH
jgi:hypothetical protein